MPYKSCSYFKTKLFCAENGAVHFDTTDGVQEADGLGLPGARDGVQEVDGRVLPGPRKRKRTTDWAASPPDCETMHLRLPITNSIPNTIAVENRTDHNSNLNSSEYYAQMLEMRVDEHHTQMELLTFQLDAAKKEHQVHLEILQKKKALYDLKFQQTMSKMISTSSSNSVQYFQSLVNNQPVDSAQSDDKVNELNDEKNVDS